MNTISCKKIILIIALILAAALLILFSSSVNAWSYGYYGGHHGHNFSIHFRHGYGHHYGYYPRYRYYSSYRSYPYYRNSSNYNYRNNPGDDYDDEDSDGADYSSSTTSMSDVDSNYGWQQLASGNPKGALKTFATQASNSPKKGNYKIGYALSAAEGGNYSKGVWAMRRAAKIDPDSLHYLSLDSELEAVINNLVEDYNNSDDSKINETDRGFMVATLNYLLHNHEAAQQALPVHDKQSSTVNVAGLIQQMRVEATNE